MTRYRIAKRAGRWAVQANNGFINPETEKPFPWQTIRFGAYRFRLLAKIHLVLLREWQRKDAK